MTNAWEEEGSFEEGGTVVTLSSREMYGKIQFSVSLGQQVNPSQVGRFIQYRDESSQIIGRVLQLVDEKVAELKAVFQAKQAKQTSQTPRRPGKALGLSALAKQDAEARGLKHTSKRERAERRRAAKRANQD